MTTRRIAHANPFDEIAGEYEAWYGSPLGTFVIAEEEGVLLDACPADRGRLLDIGAGTGWWSRVLAARGFEVTALEPSAAMRRVGAAHMPSTGVEWVAGVAERLPFADGSFDVALMVTVIEFVSQPALALGEAWRVVRPEGSLVVGFLEARSPWAALYRRLGDRGVAPWAGARFVEADDIEGWLGRRAGTRSSAVWLAPDASPPFDEADRAGRRAGNAAGFSVLRWRKEP